MRAGEQVRREHEAQSVRLLSVMRQVDLCESRTAASLGLWDASAHQAGRQVSTALDAVDKRLAPRAPREPCWRLQCRAQGLTPRVWG